MIKDEALRHPAPEQPNVRRRPLPHRTALTLGFTSVQAWAGYSLANLELTGHALWALVLVLAGVFLTIVDAWRELWTLLRTDNHHTSRDSV